MEDHQCKPTDYKNMSLDKIIEAMTADLESAAEQFVQFGVSNQQTQCHNWVNYNPSQLHHYVTNSTLCTSSSVSNITSVNSISTPIYAQDVPHYDSSPATATSSDHIYFPSQTVNNLGINENNDLIGTIDVGGGNFINVIYGNASQLVTQQCQINNISSYNSNQDIMMDQKYGFFQQPQMSVASNTSTSNGKQLIDNLVGNWVPNQSGTYSPFGGSPNVEPVFQSLPDVQGVELVQNSMEMQPKKPRKVAEVKPMRPSYSDVLTKSIPMPITPLTAAPLKPKQENASKKVLSKNTKNKTKPAVLKRQNSSGSEDHGSPKLQIPNKTIDKINSNLCRRWVSLDNIGTLIEPSSLTLNRSDNFEHKKNFKYSKKSEKDTLSSNFRIQNNLRTTNNLQKRSHPISYNINTTKISCQTVPTDKIERSQQANNKIKEDKKLIKEKSLKHFQVEKAQQIKKIQRSRKKDNKDTTFKDLYKTAYKYFSRWSKIGVKIFFWFLNLISDVVSMSANLVMQFIKCIWYYGFLYLKYSWKYMVSTFSKIHFFNVFYKQIDNWFGNSRFAFWQRLKSKTEEDEDSMTWIPGGLEVNITLPSTGDEAMKRLLSCKGKDPYSILGVTPTCTDDDIKKYYKRQAFLVHPDKNNQPGAEEAFKILVHAFDIIGEPERRVSFDQTRQVEAAWGELNDLLSQLHTKMEQAANTIRCTNCGMRHKRISTQRPCYAARFCAQCKIRHSAKEGDIWAESRMMGFLWHYYACMDGAVYNVTDWAACQANNLKHLKANIHTVQYRIVLGQRPPAHMSSNNKKRPSDPNSSKVDFEDFLHNLYKRKKTGTSNSATDANLMKGDNRRRKTKRKK